MPAIQTWTMTVDDLVAHQNKAKDITVRALIRDGLLSPEVGEAWAGSHALITHKNSWFGELWEKFRGKDEPDKYVIDMVSIPQEKKNGTTDGTREESGADDLARFNPNQES